MRILIDADGCPVVRLTEEIARSCGINTVIVCDTSHEFASDYSEVYVVGQGRDSADFALVNMCEKGDITVTQDYGLAAMILGKGAYAVSQNGLRYTDDNIGGLLESRHTGRKARASGKAHIKGPRPRTRDDDRRFEESLRQLITTVSEVRKNGSAEYEA